MSHNLILLLTPLVIIQLALVVVALVDLARRERLPSGNKLVWTLIILLFGILGPIAYLVFVRQEV